ncbi:MAG: DNA cytosine methyltransferase [Proteobacteria bacterium]|nr:DNA cytosine methyltransferase [Pseudomonadota bacterium]
MTYGSVCSGIEAATAAWHPLGWKPAFFSEIEAFPRAVLQHHYPEVPLHGDFTTIQDGDYDPIDLLVGGTPCQSFSVAGLRGGLDDDRGNLALEYLRLADRLRPRWLVWENVPGVLSSNGGRDFGAILGGLVELGYGFAYRVLDAQFFGVAQRRRRVFVVGYLGDWRRAAAVLFERHSLQGHPPPRREAGEGTAGSSDACAFALGSHAGAADGDVTNASHAGGGPVGSNISEEVAYSLRAGRLQSVAHTLKGEGFDASEDGTGRGTPIVPVSFALRGRDDGTMPEVGGAQVGALRAANGGSSRDYVAFNTRQDPIHGEQAQPLGAKDNGNGLLTGAAVRRLTPRECERLQGFPDDFTLIPWRKGMAPDGPRYKALGNSMAVPVMAWIGRRIEAVEAITSLEQAA